VWCLIAAALVLGVGVVPPVATVSRHYEYMASLQFSIFAIVVPALVAIGAPWRWLGLSTRPDPGALGVPRGPIDRLADRRLRHRELTWSLGFLICDLAVVIAWRTPAAVAAVAARSWLVPLEAASLVVVGLGLWLELVASPPLVPRSGPLRRAVLSALAMWAFWVDAYVVGLSNDDWYSNFHHVAGRGLSAAADQQVAAVVLWFVAAAAFVPVIFWNAFAWLRSEEDPDAELSRLARVERRLSPGPPRAPGPQGGGAPAP